MASPPPPCRMLFRSKDGVELFTVPSSKDAVAAATPDENSGTREWLLKGGTTLPVVFSPDGKRVYLHQPGVGVVMRNLDDSSNESPSSGGPFLKDSERVQVLTVSPKGTYVVTWERPTNNNASDPQQQQPPNLKVWDGRTGDYLHGFVQKVLKKEAWPYLHWTYDECYAFLQVTNEIRVYNGNAFSTKNEEEVRYIDKMRCQGVASVSLPRRAVTSLDNSYLLTVFVPKTKDKPARMSLLRYPPAKAVVPSNNAPAYPALVSKSLYQVEDVTVHWSPKGDAALVVMQTSVDTSGESYYGSTSLHLFLSEGSSTTAGDAINVPLPNNSTGPVLDVAWMPNPTKPSCFVVVSGRMPAMGSLHHGTTADPLFLFGNAHRNTISWSSHGRFVCLAGFGNLAGGMDFWDRNKLKKIPQYDPTTGVPNPNPELKASCTVGYGWSPDSRLFAVTTTTPRMNVDNGVRLFRYNGEQILNVPWDNKNYQPDRLLEAVFVPTPCETYPDRPQSPAPRVTGESTTPAATTTQAAAAAPKTAPAPAPKPAGRYVPPSARGKSGGGTSLAERMRKEKEENMVSATKVVPNKSAISVGGVKKTMPVGMTPPEAQGKSKNAIKKEKQRQAKARREAEEAKKKQEEESAAAAAAAAAAADPEKRARKIKKTLKQIDELKAKDPDSLNGDQKQKIATEAELREELAKLGL